MKHKPTLALCIPAYNAAKYLPKLLSSAHNQTVAFDEIWVYDDCSTDETAEVAAKLGANVVRGDTNHGCSYGKNILVTKTSCDWLHFHDADDALYPNFVEQAHKWMIQEDAPEVVLFGFEYRDAHTNELLSTRTYDDKKVREDAVAYAINEQIQSIVGIYKREDFLRAGGYDLDPLVLYNEDVAMHCQLAREGLRFAADPSVLIINYRYSQSMSASNAAKCSQSQFHVMRKMAEASNGAYSDEICAKLWKIAAVSASHLDWKNADDCIRLATSLGERYPQNASSLFKFITLINPFWALRVREKIIRRFKPSLR
jgi:glycosyltransferase involved in cell wall biosynthesis